MVLPAYRDSSTSLADAVVTLQSDALTVRIDPARGLDIQQLTHRPTGSDLLWRRNTSTMTADPLDDRPESFYDRYRGGMQELFPNAGPSCPVDGATLPFHGEACRVPWAVTASDDATALEGTVELDRYPVRLQRRFSVAGSVLRIDATATNLSRRELPVMWGFHPAFGPALTAGSAVLHADPAVVRAHPEQFGTRQVYSPGSDVRWSDGAHPLQPADSASADLLYLHCREGWYALRNVQSGLCVWMSWPVDVFPYVWLWQECHDDAGYPWFGRHHIVGVEVHTSVPGSGLGAAIEAGTARLLGGHESLTAQLMIGVDVIPPDTGVPAGIRGGALALRPVGSSTTED